MRRGWFKTSFPKPTDPANSFGGTYDAWHRLVAVTDGAGSAMKSYVPFSLSYVPFSLSPVVTEWRMWG
jgi:hypothetical protein